MVSRPGGVTLVAVLTWISGLLQVVPGVVLLLNQAAYPGTIGIAWASILIGIITVIVGASLLGGSKIARVIVTIVLSFSIAAEIVTVIFLPSEAWSAIATALVSLIGLILLWTGRASDWFNTQDR